MMRHLLLLILTAFSWAACQQPGGGTNIIPDPNTKPEGGGQPEKKTETIQVSFTESTEYLLNPERGFYGGAVGYFSSDGNMDLAITIRTLEVKNGRIKVQAGCGIVADSVPEMEYQETLNKARALFKAVEFAEGGLR